MVAEREGEEATDAILDGTQTIRPGIGEPAPDPNSRHIGVSELPTKTGPQGGDERRCAVSDLGKDLHDFVSQEPPNLILQATVLERGIAGVDRAIIEQRVIRIDALEPSRSPITPGMPVPPNAQAGLGNEAGRIRERLSIKEIPAGHGGRRPRRRRRGSGDSRDARGVLITNAAEVLGLGGPQIDRNGRGERISRNHRLKRGDRGDVGWTPAGQDQRDRNRDRDGYKGSTGVER